MVYVYLQEYRFLKILILNRKGIRAHVFILKKKLEKNKNTHKKQIDEYTIKISFLLRSNGFVLCFFNDVPKTTSNQHFEKPIKPKTLATKNINIVINGVISNKPQKI